MPKRFVTIWFCYLRTDWFTRRQPNLRDIPFILAYPDHGRMVVTGVNALAQKQGVDTGMVVADARAIIPSLQVLDDKPELPAKLLKGLAEWCIRYTPVVAIDPPDGLILDVTGCAHLWGGEKKYLTGIIKRFKHFGYEVRVAMADTIGTAWAIARFGKNSGIIENSQQTAALLYLPAAALRLEAETIERLEKLGLRQIRDFISIPRSALRRRFGQRFLQRLDQALGYEEEVIKPVQPIEPYQEWLPCLEPIVTATGIEIALQRLLDTLCHRLQHEEKGLRVALFKGYRVDGKIEKIEIGTNHPSCNSRHLFKLFENKIGSIEPALGIELFTLDASKIEDASPVQEKLWENNGGLDDIRLSELLDRLAGRIGANNIHRYVPDEHYWPERSFKPALSINEKLQATWKVDRPRPLQLLSKPDPIEVTAPIPDYPPMSFRYKGKFHKVIKADGPERIEQEWWLQNGQHRDYYCVEDEEGKRYWLFRSGHYDAARSYKWFIHGFFA
ncbi:MAG: DNA polymerase Y family protein [Ginsengibacter sp.]